VEIPTLGDFIQEALIAVGLMILGLVLLPELFIRLKLKKREKSKRGMTST